MLASWIKYELKNILGNKMTVMMIFYPFLLAGIGRYIIEGEFAPLEAMQIYESDKLFSSVPRRKFLLS